MPPKNGTRTDIVRKKLGELQLVSTDAIVIRGAEALRRNPDNFLIRVQELFSSVAEQKLYLILAPSFRILPESMERILRRLRGSNPLTTEEFISSAPYSRATEALDALSNVLEIIEKQSELSIYGLHSISIENALVIVQLYGDSATAILEELVCSIHELQEIVPIRGSRICSDKLVFETALYALAGLCEQGIVDGGSVVETLREHFANPALETRALLSGRESHDTLSRNHFDYPSRLREMIAGEETWHVW